MRATINRKDNEIFVVQEQYINQILQRFNIECKEVLMPMETKANLLKDNSCSGRFPYQQLVGSLINLTVSTRPNIAFPVPPVSLIIHAIMKCTGNRQNVY